MKQFKLTLVLTILMSMAGLQAFADWDTSIRVHINGVYYYLDKDNLQAQVTSPSASWQNYKASSIFPITLCIKGIFTA